MTILCNIAKRIVYRVLVLASMPVKQTYWYKNLFVDFDHERYPDNVWYRAHDERNFDVVNLGSSSAKWAFDYSDVPIKGMNWANQPQTLIDDLRLFKNFHSILRKGGTVIITIMPFTGLNKETGLMDCFKFLGTLDWTLLDPLFRDLAAKFRQYPILLGRHAISATIRHFLGQEQCPQLPLGAAEEKNPMDAEELEQDAKQWMNGWAKQFGISDFEASLTHENMEGREVRIAVMREFIDFVLERGYKPVYVIPPVTVHLGQYFTPAFREAYIDSFLRDVHRDIRLLNYLDDYEFHDDLLYFNSLFLNVSGRKHFTHRVISDLGMKIS